LERPFKSCNLGVLCGRDTKSGKHVGSARSNHAGKAGADVAAPGDPPSRHVQPSSFHALIRWPCPPRAPFVPTLQSHSAPILSLKRRVGASCVRLVSVGGCSCQKKGVRPCYLCGPTTLCMAKSSITQWQRSFGPPCSHSSSFLRTRNLVAFHTTERRQPHSYA
jgi:hypothetical protein